VAKSSPSEHHGAPPGYVRLTMRAARKRDEATGLRICWSLVVREGPEATRCAAWWRSLGLLVTTSS
jgi:hypothetical protein